MTRTSRRWKPVAAIAAGAMLLVVGVVASWIYSLGPVPLGTRLDFPTAVVDRDGRLLRPYATPEGRWRLPAQADGVDPRYLSLLIAYEDKRFRSHAGVDPAALLRAAGQMHRARPHRVGRLDADDAGRAPSRAAQRAFARRQAPPDRSRRRARARAHQGRGARPLPEPRALWRQSRRHPRRLARLLRQGAAAARRSASWRCSSRCRNRRRRGGPTAPPMRRGARATACSTASRRAACSPTPRSRRPRPSRCPQDGRRCRCSPPMPPTRRWRRSRAVR